jgi:RHS repeat-associated protein
LETRFDSRNRPTQRILGSTVGTYDFTYAGPNDELTAIAAQSGFADPVGGSTIGASWVYNQSGQLVSETTQGNRTTTYAYSAALLRLTSLTDAIGTRNVRYDAATGAADSMSDPTDGWIRYTFGTDGRVHGPWVDGTGEAFSRTQNWKQSTGMSSVTNAHGYEVGKWSSSIFEEDDTLTTKWAEIRGSGNPTIEMPDSITYDGWERVTAIKHLKDGQLVASESFAFDGRGNLTIDSGATAFNVMDRLTASPGCTSISYDPAGNLTGRTCGGVSWSYTYDALDRLTNVSNSGGLSAAYTYDVLGNRIAKKVNAALVRFVWRSGHLVYETSGAGTIKYSYQWGYSTDDLIAIHDHATGAHFYVVQDQLRSLRGLVNRNGAWAASWRYRAYGAPLDSAGSALNAYRRFRWAGAQYDEETGFYFLRTRYYDPTIGRFVQEDKIGHAGGANLYMYVGGGPLDARDPTGTAKIYDTHFTFLPNCWNVFECRDGFHALDPYGRDGGGYQSVSSIPPGFFSNAVVSVLNYGLAQMIAMDVHRAANPTGRPMTDAERAAVGNACDQVKCDRVRITEGNQFARGFTIGYGIYINGTLDMTLHAAKFLLAHELWHVYQWQTRGSLWYTWYGLGSFVSRAAFWRSPYSLPVGGPGSTNIWDYGFEQQGNIVASCVTNPLSAWCKVSPWY